MSDGFELDGLEALGADLERIIEEYPEEASRFTVRMANRFTKDVNEKFPADYDNGKRSLPKSWKKEQERTGTGGYVSQVNIRNTAPHFHLVENGHEMVIPEQGFTPAGRKNSDRDKKPGRKKQSGKKWVRKGFVPGKHYCEITRNEWKEKFPELTVKFLDKLLKKKML